MIKLSNKDEFFLVNSSEWFKKKQLVDWFDPYVTPIFIHLSWNVLVITDRIKSLTLVNILQ